MGYISDLPFEILEDIFNELSDSEVSTRISLHWLQDQPTPSRALFPFNIASTCMMWLSVLKSRPKYWHQVVIDVADDPAPFLDTLALFKSNEYRFGFGGRKIVVFSSLKEYTSQKQATHGEDIHEEAKIIENARVRTVFECLEGSLGDCIGITFDLVYQSSLPSVVRLCSHRLPALRNLSLTCVIHDCDEVVFHRCHDQLYRLHSLDTVAMTGASFMELCGRNCGGLRRSPMNGQALSKFSIDHFIFNNVKQASILANICFSTALSLSDLTLTCPALEKPDLVNTISAVHLTLDSVSSNLLEAFIPTLFDWHTVQVITFRKCVIPKLFSEVFPGGNPYYLRQLVQLIDIPHTEDIYSLYDVICALTPMHLQLRHCEVTDKLLIDLATPKCAGIDTVQLHDCSGFSSAGVRAFVSARREQHRKDPHRNFALQLTEVYGTGPLLASDDAAFFLGEKTESTGDEELDEPSSKEILANKTGDDPDEYEEQNEQVEGISGDNDSDNREGNNEASYYEDTDIAYVKWNVMGHDDVPNGYIENLRRGEKPYIPSMFRDCPVTRASKIAMYST